MPNFDVSPRAESSITYLNGGSPSFQPAPSDAAHTRKRQETGRAYQVMARSYGPRRFTMQNLTHASEERYRRWPDNTGQSEPTARTVGEVSASSRSQLGRSDGRHGGRPLHADRALPLSSLGGTRSRRVSSRLEPGLSSTGKSGSSRLRRAVLRSADVAEMVRSGGRPFSRAQFARWGAACGAISCSLVHSRTRPNRRGTVSQSEDRASFRFQSEAHRRVQQQGGCRSAITGVAIRRSAWRRARSARSAPASEYCPRQTHNPPRNQTEYH